MEILMVDYVMLANKVLDLVHLIDEASDKIMELNDVTKELSVFWDGVANEEFVVAIGEDIAKTAVLLKSIRKTIKLVAIALNDYQSTEKVIRQIIEEN